MKIDPLMLYRETTEKRQHSLWADDTYRSTRHRTVDDKAHTKEPTVLQGIAVSSVSTFLSFAAME
jgi:hypothetical protein